jgi:hypothetical protein
MSDALWAARLGDALSHTSMMADILGGVLEVAANIAITAVVAATAWPSSPSRPPLPSFIGWNGMPLAG